jgi:hypothetical protein
VAISRTQAVSATANNVAIASCAAGDIIVVWSYFAGTATIPTLAAGFTNIVATAGTQQAARLAYKVAVGGETSSGTWTNATQVVCMVYRGASGFGATPTIAAANSTSISMPAVTLQDTSGGSVILGFAGAASATAGMNSNPTGGTVALTNRANQVKAAGLDSAATAANYTAQTLTVTTSGRVQSVTIELKATPGPITASASITFDALTSVGDVDVAATGNASNTLGALTLSSSGTVVDPPINASANVTFGALTLSALGNVATPLNHGDVLATWPDLSGTGHTAIGVNSPLLALLATPNGKASAVVQSGAFSGFSLASAIPATGDWTVIAVMYCYGNQLYSTSSFATGGNGPAGTRLYQGNAYVQVPPANGGVIGGSPQPGGFAVYTGFGLSTVGIRINGTPGLLNTIYSGTQPGNFDTLGSDFAAGQYGDGYLVEILLYDHILTLTQMQNLEAYAAAENGLTVAGGTPVNPTSVSGFVGWWKGSSVALPVVLGDNYPTGASTQVFNDTQGTGQVFTCTQPGRLTLAEFNTYRGGNNTGTLVCRIWTVSGGLPGTVLAETSVPVESVAGSGTYRFVFNGANRIMLVAGQQYAITFAYVYTGGSGGFLTTYDPSGTDPGYKIENLGSGWFLYGSGLPSSSDQAYRIYVTPPTAGDPIGGTASITLGALTLSSDATHPVIVTASITLGALTLSSVTVHPVIATSSITLGSCALVSTASAISTGNTSVTLGALTLSSAATHPVVANASNTLGTLTLGASVSIPVVASSSIALSTLTLSASGSVGTVVSTGDLNVTFGALTLNSAAAVSLKGNTNVTFGAIALSAAAKASVIASASTTLDALTLSATAKTTATANASITLAVLTSSATASIRTTANASITLGTLTLLSSGGAVSSIVGSLNVTLGALSASASATVQSSANASITLGSLISTSAAAALVKANSSVTFSAIALSAAAVARASCTASITFDQLNLSADASSVVRADADILLDELIASGALVQPPLLIGGKTLGGSFITTLAGGSFLVTHASGSASRGSTLSGSFAVTRTSGSVKLEKINHDDQKRRQQRSILIHTED